MQPEFTGEFPGLLPTSNDRKGHDDVERTCSEGRLAEGRVLVPRAAHPIRLLAGQLWSNTGNMKAVLTQLPSNSEVDGYKVARTANHAE